MVIELYTLYVRGVLIKNIQTLLLVDDVKENIDVLVELLKEYDLITAIDGKTALEAAESEDIDLILLDIMMPDMDGFEVCNILKSNKKTSNIPIIFLTALDKQEELQKGFELGAVDYITKPFNPNELMSRVHTHLKLRAYEKDLELRVEEELEKNKIKQEMIHQQSKQAALGELLMHIAHQWKQPLASLSALNISQKIKIEQELDSTKDEKISKIEKAQDLINFMSTTVETFRNFYQPSYSSETFSLTSAVSKVLSISDATLKYDKIKICLNSSEKAETYGNANEFTQIVFSIINNAREIFKQREIKDPEIKIDIQNYQLTISDNGGGIDENIILDIFEPFTSSTKSSGIGLYIAKEITEKNGGYISVSNDDKGAVFKVEFPHSTS
ncbi:response regulator [Sulfurimonas sp.]|uniref:hybrid sensor histidine kinase/response regulator n=1 Tax=Sulfurimonas sp. TaxID=2022749 RepID=UPI0035655454